MAGLLLPLLSASEGELILIEEPEAQLHVSTQIMMSLLLIAVAAQKKLKIVFSTHSDLLALGVHYIQDIKPNQESLSDLIKKMVTESRVASESISHLAHTIANNYGDFKSTSYYFEQDGNSRLISKEELRKNVPGISDTVEKFYNWTVTELLKKRKSDEKIDS
jgi:hypothetical protein